MTGRHLARALALAVALVASVTAGCGEDVVASPFGWNGPPASAPTSTAGAVQALAACPARMPRDGEACATSGLVCEYGDALDPTCSPVAECDGRAWWRREPTCTARCPRARSAITPGAPCDPRGDAGDAGEGADAGGARSELLCGYPGELCGCTTDAAGALAWRCLPADPGCPEERPRIGSACTSLKTCDYGACAFESGLAIACTELEGSYTRTSVWLVREPSCSPTGRTP